MPPVRRPGSVTTFAVLNIVFGSLGALGLLAGLAMTGNDPVTEAMRSHSFLGVWDTVTTLIGGLVAIALIFIGVGMLSLKIWARKACIIYGIYSIVMSIVSTLVTFMVLKPFLDEVVAGTLGGEFGLGSMGSTIVSAAIMGAMIGIILAIVYASLLMYFMTRPHVREAFEMKGDAIARAFE